MINRNQKTILFFLFWSMTFSASSQSALIASGGAGSTEGIHLSWTIGELVTGSTSMADGIMLTQGIQQPEMDITISTIALEAKEFSLFQNMPNPFNAYTIITFTLPQPTQITLNIFDAMGKKVVSSVNRYGEGIHFETVNKDDLGATGIYYYQLVSPGFTVTKKMILVD